MGGITDPDCSDRRQKYSDSASVPKKNAAIHLGLRQPKFSYENDIYNYLLLLYPQQDSNLHYEFRKLGLSPLSYGGKWGSPIPTPKVVPASNGFLRNALLGLWHSGEHLRTMSSLSVHHKTSSVLPESGWHIGDTGAIPILALSLGIRGHFAGNFVIRHANVPLGSRTSTTIPLAT